MQFSDEQIATEEDALGREERKPLPPLVKKMQLANSFQ